MIEYEVVSNPNLIDLKREVRDMISDGWEPLGGITSDAECLYLQAMVRRDPTTPGAPQDTAGGRDG